MIVYINNRENYTKRGLRKFFKEGIGKIIQNGDWEYYTKRGLRKFFKEGIEKIFQREN